MNEKSTTSKRSQMSSPFGMAQIQKISYSQISHLNPDDVLFFKSIDIKNEDENDTDDLFRMSMLDTVSGATNDQATAKTTTTSLQQSKSKVLITDSSKSAAAEETCDLPGCRQIKVKIKDIYLINHAEREKIHEKVDKIKATMKALEKKHNHTINKFNVGKNEYSTSLSILNDLDIEIRHCENIKADLYKDRSEIENKIMILEADHQYLLRAIADTQKAISTAIFSSQRKCEAEENNIESIDADSSFNRSSTGQYSSANKNSSSNSPTTSNMIITYHTMNNRDNTPTATANSKADIAKKYKQRSEQINFPFMPSYTPLASLSVIDSTEFNSNNRSNTTNNNATRSDNGNGSAGSQYHYFNSRGGNNNNNSSSNSNNRSTKNNNSNNNNINGGYIDTEDPLSWKSVFSANNSSFYKSIHNPKNLPHVLNFSTTNSHYSIADNDNDDNNMNNMNCGITRSMSGSFGQSIKKAATMSSLTIPPPYTMPRRGHDVSSRYRNPSLRYTATTPHRRHKTVKHHTAGRNNADIKSDGNNNNENNSDSSDDDKEESVSDKLKRELSSSLSNNKNKSLLNPIYYQDKASNLFGRQNPIGKLRKINNNRILRNNNNQTEEDNDDDDEDDFRMKVSNNNIINNSKNNTNENKQLVEYQINNKTKMKYSTNNNNNNTPLLSLPQSQYKKKHFAKLLTFNHPGISEHVLRKHNISSGSTTVDDDNNY